MSISMQGTWTITVKSKHAAYNQRFVVQGSTNGKDGVHAGSIGTSVVVAGPQWSVAVENDQGTGNWVPSNERISTPATIGGMLAFDIKSDDGGGSGGNDRDYDDLVLTCSLVPSDSEFVLYGKVRSYSGLCRFNPCFPLPYVVIDTPGVLQRSLADARIRGAIEALYPERLRRFEKQLEHGKKVTERTGGGIMVMTEGVFGMAGDQGKLKEIVSYKKKYNFRLFVDDAHGFGQLGREGRGTGDEQGVQNEIDVYFGTFAKGMATIGAFLSGDEDVMMFLRYNMRSQTFAKSLPMPIVIGAIKRLEMLRTMPELKDKLWTITNALQDGLRNAGMDLGTTNSCVTPVYLKGGIPEATSVIVDLRENYGSIVVYPVIPKDTILLRLIPTAAHSMEDVNYTVETFKKVKAKLEAGEYQSERILNMN